MRSLRVISHSGGAFTLIEMVVVVALIAILAAMTIPEMQGSFDDALLRSSGRDLVDVFGLASSRAVSLDRRFQVKFDLQTGQYIVERESHNDTGDDFIPLKDVSGAQGKIDPRIAIRLLFPDQDASGKGLDLRPRPANAADAVAFYPDGTADAAEIRLRDRAGFELRLQINPITARVQVTGPEHE